MIDTARGNTHYSLPGNPQPPTEVYLLAVGKELSVKSADGTEVAGAHHEAGTCSPMNFQRGVILSAVILHFVEETASAIGVTVSVDEASCRPCIFETCGAARCALAVDVVFEQFRLHRRHVRVGVHIVNERFKPSLGRVDIAVEEHEIVRFHLAESLVVAIGKAPVLLHHDSAHLGKLLPEHLQRVVRGSVVGDNHLARCGLRVGDNSRKEPPEHGGSVPVEYDDGGLCHYLSASI